MFQKMEAQMKKKSQMINDMREEIKQLKEKVGENNKKNPNTMSYKTSLDKDLYSIQWQSLHMAAAAACRGSTSKGGHGGYANVVIPRNKDISCTATCKMGGYKYCDAELAILGSKGQVKESYKVAGYFYNYGCDYNKPNPQSEADLPG